MSDNTEQHLPTWIDTVHNDARKFGHINEFSDAAWALGYKYICWNDRIYILWEDETGFLWANDIQLLREDVDRQHVSMV